MSMTFCTLLSERVFQAEIVTLSCLFFCWQFAKPQKLIHQCHVPQKGKSQKINANKAHEKVYFKYCLRRKKFFLFRFLHFWLVKRQKLFSRIPCHTISFLNFFTTRSEIKQKLLCKKFLTANRSQEKLTLKITKKNHMNFHLHFCEVQRSPRQEQKFYFYIFDTFFVLWEWRTENSEQKRSENKNLHSSFRFLSKEWSFCSIHISGAEYASYMWWFLWVLTHHHEYRQDNEMKSLEKSEWNFADTIMS